jgi:hypothetical protein
MKCVHGVNYSNDFPFVLSGTGVNAKTCSGVRFNQYIDSDLRGFTRQKSSLQTLRGCSMATSILHSQNFRFQITIYLEGNWDF